MAAAWSKICSSSNYIYYKTHEHLYSYYNILEDRKKYRDTVAYKIDASRSVRLLGQCKRRCVSLEQAKKYRCLEPNLLTCTSIASTNTTEVAKEAPVDIAPGPPIEIVEPIAITRGSLENEVLSIAYNQANEAYDTIDDQTTEALIAFSSGNNSLHKGKERAPRKCQLCGNYSPVCKGRSRPKLCQFKYGICIRKECTATYGGDAKCILSATTEAENSDQ
ncbi:hypothetical protein BD560DRAFT_436909 [Blakeslea trispora]|nr:hypothetical protein BD560DRAFT_436909 [Blakeslea trispora]